MGCLVCDHDKRTEIELRISEGVSVRKIGAEFGVNFNRVQRHKKDCLPEEAARQARVLARPAPASPIPPPPAPLVPPPVDAHPTERLRYVHEETLMLLRELRSSGRDELALKAIQRLEKQIEVQLRLLGELTEKVEVSGPNGGPIPIAALVAQLPPLVQQLHLQAEQGDAHAALLLDRYARTGEETLEGQIRATRALLVELEAEVGLR